MINYILVLKAFKQVFMLKKTVFICWTLSFSSSTRVPSQPTIVLVLILQFEPIYFLRLQLPKYNRLWFMAVKINCIAFTKDLQTMHNFWRNLVFPWLSWPSLRQPQNFIPPPPPLFCTSFVLHTCKSDSGHSEPFLSLLKVRVRSSVVQLSAVIWP